MNNAVSVNPVLVETTRGKIVESRHRGAIAVVRSNGQLLASWGDIDNPIYSRSSMKPFQTLATLETDAFTAFDLGSKEVALHAASHSGEAGHIEVISQWLEKIGLQESDLQCGVQTPYWVMLNWARAFEADKPRQLFNNCSGKHAGFLTAVQHKREDVSNYLSLQHPTQISIRRLLSEMTEFDESLMTASTDLCRAPVYAIPLRNFAHGLAKIANPEQLSSKRADATQLLMNSMLEHPWLVAGTDRADTLLMQDESFIGFAKCGAEGFYAMAFPEHDIGVAIKIDDGADRAASVAAVAVLKKLGVLSEQDVTRLENVGNPILRTWEGIELGMIKAATTLS